MKFRIASLFWLALVVAVVLMAYALISRQRAEAERKVAEANRAVEQMRGDLTAIMAREDVYRRKLGLLPESDGGSEPYIRMLELPEEFGGWTLQGLPFDFRWRMRLERLDAADLCVALKNIPVAPNVDEVPDEAVFRFRPDDAAAVSAAGQLAVGGNSQPQADQPAHVTVVARLNRSEGHAVLTFDALIEQGNQRFFRQRSFRAPMDEEHWLTDSTLAMHRYAFAGFGVDSTSRLELLDQPLDLAQPILMLHLRGKRRIDEFKFEDVSGPCDGLMIWLERRSEQQGD